MRVLLFALLAWVAGKNPTFGQGLLVNGENHTARVEAGEEDTWTFEAKQDDVVYLRMSSFTASFLRIYPRFSVRAPDGSDAGSGSGSLSYDADFSFRAAQPGLFQVVAGSLLRDVGGSYTLRFVKVPAVPVIPANDQGGPLSSSNYFGTIPFGDLDSWTFEANQGDAIGIDMRELTGVGFSPSLQVHGPAGQLVASHTHPSLAHVSFLAPDSGIYVMVVSSGARGGSGTYELTATGLPEQGKQLRWARPAPDLLKISWPSALTRHALQESPALAMADWAEVGAGRQDNGLNAHIIVAIMPAGDAFFRLRAPGGPE